MNGQKEKKKIEDGAEMNEAGEKLDQRKIINKGTVV